jgi:DNA (cytosine-5)-methyltransferase 1
LSVRELANLQTFPPDVHFMGSRSAVQRQIGNAVPSLITEVLGREIMRQFLGRTPDQPLHLAVDLKRPIPLPESVRPVPQQFVRPPVTELTDYVPRYLGKKRGRGGASPDLLGI